MRDRASAARIARSNRSRRKRNCASSASPRGLIAQTREKAPPDRRDASTLAAGGHAARARREGAEISAPCLPRGAAPHPDLLHTLSKETRRADTEADQHQANKGDQVGNSREHHQGAKRGVAQVHRLPPLQV